MLYKKWLKPYLVFNRKDRIGIACFLIIVNGCIFLPGLLSKAPKVISLKEDQALALAIDTLQKKQVPKKDYAKDENDYSYQYEPTQTKGFTNAALFQFDPNQLKAQEWQRLGLNEKTSKTIEKYVSKGGKFYKPEDLMKIWGMPEGFYQRVKDYILIAPVARNYPQNNYSRPSFEKEERKLSVLNINEADTSGFISLPGIGSKLSGRIVSFREKLGGFYSVDQIGETYGLPDSTFQKIKTRLQVEEISVRKLNLNSATKDELKAHPYIRWNLANAIVEYRNQHGSFKNLEDLRNIALVDEVTYNKIIHYLNL